MVLWTFSVLVGLVLIIVGVLSVYPSKRMGVLASRYLTAALERPVRIQQLAVRPWGVVEVQGVTIGGAADEPPGEPILTLQRLGVRVRLLPLLRRKLEVVGIQIEDPRVHLFVPPDTSGIQAVEQIPSMPQEMPTLPFSLGLFRLTLHNARAAVTLPDSTGGIFVSLSGLNADVAHVRVPRSPLSELEALRGEIHLRTEKGTGLIFVRGAAFRFETNVRLDAKWEADEQWQADLSLAAHPLDPPTNSGLDLDVRLTGTGPADAVDIAQCDFRLFGQRIVGLRGAVDQQDGKIRFDLAASGDAVDLARLRRDVTPFLPDTVLSLIRPFETTGVWRLASARIQWSPDRFTFHAATSLSRGAFADSVSGLAVSGASADLSIQGEGNAKDFAGGTVSFDAAVDSIRSAMSDTSLFTLSDLYLESESHLDADFFPTAGWADLRLQNLFDGSAQIRVDWSSDDSAVCPLSALRMHGTARIDSLQLGALPSGSATRPKGLVYAAADWTVRGVDSIGVSTEVRTPGVMLIVSETEEVMSPMRLTSGGLVRTDTTLTRWTLDPFHIQLDSLFFAEATVDADLDSQIVRLRVEQARLVNSVIPDYLPASVRKLLDGAVLGGEERMHASVTAHIGERPPEVYALGAVRIHDADVRLPMLKLTAGDVGGELTFTGTPNQLRGNIDISVEEIALSVKGTNPLTGNRLRVAWRMQVGDSLILDVGRFDVRSLGLESRFEAAMDLGSEVPSLSADLQTVFHPQDSVEIVEDILSTGRMTVHLRARQSASENPILRLSGEAVIDSLDVSARNQFAVQRIRGRVPFHLDFDLAAGALYIPVPFDPVPWDDYDMRRSLYRNLWPQLGELHVRRIAADRYEIRDLALDLLIEQSAVQIPWFNARVLGGNVGGSLWIDAGRLHPDSLTYAIRVQASRINAASLTNLSAGDDQVNELNATLSFRGRGVDLKTGVDLDGACYITKIGPRFASTLLQGLDPKGVDRSIRMTRRLLNTGWKPRLFSFELRHAHVYPALALDQPWFSPIRLPGELAYGRIPLAFFLRLPSDESD